MDLEYRSEDSQSNSGEASIPCQMQDTPKYAEVG